MRLSKHLAIALAAVCGAGSAIADAPSPVQPYLDFVHGLAVGDAARALAAFAPDARVVAGPACPPAAPCIGHAAIRERYLLPALARHDPLPIRDQRFDGVWLRTRGEWLPAGPGPAARGGHAFELRGGQIVSLIQQREGDAAAPPGPHRQGRDPRPRIAPTATSPF